MNEEQNSYKEYRNKKCQKKTTYKCSDRQKYPKITVNRIAFMENKEKGQILDIRKVKRNKRI